MKKRTFIKLSSAMITGAALGPIASCSPEKRSDSMTLKNWAGNLTYSTSSIAEPASIEEAQEIISRSTRIRVLGTRHCFNRIADSSENLISTKSFNQVFELHGENRTLTVGGGIRYGEFCKCIHDRGFAIHNLASLPHISVAGACATATHGSGVKNGNLATSASALEYIAANGELVKISRKEHPDIFPGAVVNLGCIGLVTKVTLDLVPTFKMRQDVYLNLPMSQLDNHFNEIMSAGYSVSLFTDWQTETINQVWIKRVVVDEDLSAEKEFFGAVAADRNVHPILEISAENCTEQMGVPGPWYERLPHFKMGFTPSSGEELQAEYFVPREKAVEAIRAVHSLREEIKPHLLITEIRTIAADDLWLSPCYQQDSVAIHFTLKQNIEGVQALLPKIEEKLSPFNVRPHWGKLFTVAPGVLQSRYEKLADFKKLLTKYDPNGKFRNEFIDTNLFGANKS